MIIVFVLLYSSCRINKIVPIIFILVYESIVFVRYVDNSDDDDDSNNRKCTCHEIQYNISHQFDSFISLSSKNSKYG
jgi:hypothetical protein